MIRKTKARIYTTAIAGGLGILCAGLGLAYLGRRREAIAAAATMLLVLAISAWTGLIFNSIGFYAMVALLVMIAIGSVGLSVYFAWSARRKPPPGKRWDVVLFMTIVSAVFYVVAVSHRTALLGYDLFRVSSSSMGETLIPGDAFMSDVRKYRANEPSRYDVIIYRFPGDAQIKYIARIVGLPGERVEIKGGRVHVNGARLSEPYVKPEYNRATSRLNLRYVVPQNHYFVMGDYRDRSNDSRYWGMLPRANVHGTVEFIAWSSRPSWQLPGDVDWDKDRRGNIRWERLGKTIE